MQANLLGELRYSFDESGRKSKLVYFDTLQPKVTIDYFYSKAGFVEGIEAEIYGRTLSWERTRDELQRPKLELLPNGIQSSYEFDNLSRLTNLDHVLPDTKMLSGFNYSFSETGNITNQTRLVGGYDAPTGTISDDLGYDSLDRLINSGRGESFTYDLLGNRSGPGYVTNNLNQLLEDPKFTYQYSERGNLTHKFNKDKPENFEYHWNIENQLIGVTIRDGLIPKMILAFEYDGLGRRTKKTVTNLAKPEDSYTRKYIYDGEDILFELDGTDRIIAAYLHGPGIDEPIAMLRDLNKNQKFEADEIFTYTKDHLGSVRDITNSNAELVQRYDFSSYGITKLEKDPANPAYKFIENNYTYTAQDYDVETGLTRHGVRWYDAFSGRWLSPDPIGLLGGLNEYLYSLGSPLRYIDTSGRDAVRYTVITSGGYPHSILAVSSPKGVRYIDFGPIEDFVYTGIVLGESEISNKLRGKIISAKYFPATPEQDEEILKRAFSTLNQSIPYNPLGLFGGQNCFGFTKQVCGNVCK